MKDKHFWCAEDSKHWATDDYCAPEQVPDNDLVISGAEDEYNFFAKCPVCKAWCRSVPHYYANLERMRHNATGPKTEDGKRRSSVNGMKHGGFAQAHHLIAPANGKYDICGECDIKDRCEAKELRYCPYKQDLMVRFMAAVENGDVNSMKQFAGLSLGRLYVILENMFQEIMEKGPAIKQPRLSGGKVVTMETNRVAEDGTPVEETLWEYTEHPLLGEIPKIMNTLGMTSDQQKMNPSKQEDAGAEDPGNMKQPTDPINFLKSMTEMVNAIRNGSAPDVAKAKREEDPVYREMTKGSKDEDGEEEVPEINNPFRR